MLGKHSKLEFRNLFNQLGDNQTTYRTGRDLEGGNDLRNYAFRYRQRAIYSGQLHGSHELGEKSELQWTLGYGKAISKEPDFRRISTRRDLNTGDAQTAFAAYIPLSADPFNAGRSFSDLNEDVYTARADYERTVSESDVKWERETARRAVQRVQAAGLQHALALLYQEQRLRQHAGIPAPHGHLRRLQHQPAERFRTGRRHQRQRQIRREQHAAGGLPRRNSGTCPSLDDQRGRAHGVQPPSAEQRAVQRQKGEGGQYRSLSCLRRT